jgi:hypothetical protein
MAYAIIAIRTVAERGNHADARKGEARVEIANRVRDALAKIERETLETRH